MSASVERTLEVIAGVRSRCAGDAHTQGPVPLATYFAETNLDHVELPALTIGAVTEHLQRQGIPIGSLGNAADALAGFVFAGGRVGWAYVSSADPVPRRRFTAAHELGHFMLHRETMGQFRADTDATLREADEEVTDSMEREANRFAVELLMPADFCRRRAADLRRNYGCCPRGVLVYRLASELLVSRQALRFRLQALEVGDE
jgi:Zn-dependent peptidase ImmA (M78 family)